MPTLLRLLSEYFWLIALGFGVFNYRKGLVAAQANGQSSEGAIYVKWFAVAANVPWVVMGLGALLGYTPTVWHYFRPQDGNPFVIAWLAVAFFITCAYSWWVLFAGGAQKVRDLNLMTTVGMQPPKPFSLFAIKVFAGVAPLLFPVWIYLAISMNAPIPMPSR